MIKGIVKGIFKALKYSKFARILIALIYIISPYDIMPEAILGALGFVDDGAAIFYIIKTIVTDSAGRFIIPHLSRFGKAVLRFIFIALIIAAVLIYLLFKFMP
ncbi:MAG: DUF1232 domain-containing protein [Spirochaetales bacterium]|nr:DUF1232 domain-containing protein [Spirochaetales bacterium]